MKKNLSIKYLVADNWLSIVVFLILLLIVAAMHWSNNFLDPDAFYHAKLSSLLWERGLNIDFNSLPFTTLQSNYTDHHLIYHIFVSPLTLIFGPWLALKIMSVMLSGIFMVVFWRFLNYQRVPFSWLFVVLLIVNQSFLFRLSLGKSLPLVLILIIFSLYALWQKRIWLSLILGWLFVWSYAGWPLLPILYASYWLLSVFCYIIKNRRIKNRLPAQWFKGEYVRILVASLLGVLLGLVTSPYWSENLHFYWNQFWQIAVVNYRSVIDVGGEWYGMSVLDMVSQSEVLFVLLVWALFGLLFHSKKVRFNTWWTGFWTLLFLIMTLKSQRYIEFFVPFAFLFVGLFARDVELRSRLAVFMNKWRYQYKRLKAGYILLIIYFVSGTIWLTIRELGQNYNYLHNGIDVDSFDHAAEFLRLNTRAGDVIFHSDWDEFPLLFYELPNRRYISGLDPTFLYLSDSELYWQWVNITTGKLRQGISEIIVDKFNAKIVFVDAGHDQLKANLLMSGGWKKAYEDQRITIFKLKNI